MKSKANSNSSPESKSVDPKKKNLKSKGLKVSQKKENDIDSKGSFGNVLRKILTQSAESKSTLSKPKVIKDEERPRKASSQLQKQKEKFDWEEMCRAKPDVLDKERERKLQRIATRGVVALFNAVRQQQKLATESKKDKKAKALVTETKKSFISKLNDETTAQEIEDDGTWKALRDDFMSSTTTKDWDKDDDDDDNAME